MAWSSPWMILPRLTSRPSDFGEHQGVERQQQPVVLGELVAEDEADGDELGRLAPAFGGHALDGVKFGLKDTKIHLRLHRQTGGQPPLGTFDILHIWRERDLVFRRLGEQPFRAGRAVRVILCLHPFWVGVPRNSPHDRSQDFVGHFK